MTSTKTPTTPSDNPTPATLAAWQHAAGLSPAGAAQLLGVPVFTYRKWADGTRRPDAAALRLIQLVQLLHALAPDLLAMAAPPGLAADAPPPGQDGRQRRRGRPAKAQVPPAPENAPAAPESL